MKRVERFVTYDGLEHVSQAGAERHLDRIYGEELCRITREIIVLDGKYGETQKWLDRNIDRFGALLAIKADLELENPEEE